MATSNFRTIGAEQEPGQGRSQVAVAPSAVARTCSLPYRRLAAGGTTALAAIVCLLGHAETPAQSPGSSATLTSAATRCERTFHETREEWRKQPTNAAVACRFGRAAFAWAEFATNDTQRAEVASLGIAACRRAVQVEPASAAAHYYLALNLGQSARTKLLGALKLVEEMETRFKKSIELDPAFAYAGAHRSLGVLYRDAPGWPTSIGSRTRARRHLEKAVELAPDYPGNRLALLESCLKWGDRRAARTQVPSIEESFKSARTKLTGETWAADWLEWEQRLENAKSRMAAAVSSSPRE